MIWTVSEISNNIRQILKDNIKGQLTVTGEVSNLKISGNHLFFTLKDEEATIGCVIWNFHNKLDIKIENGNKISIKGRIDYFRNGNVQINTTKVELIGHGELHQHYMALKDKYDKLGYFDGISKKNMPERVNKIGIVTSKDGAALEDLLYVLKKGQYNGIVFVKNASVQGKQCPISVSTGIQILDDKDLDVIIIARGGGSYEDLFGFSNELVVETIRNAQTCIISAIGHEIDFMLSDFVADIRAPTPSIAGEIICSQQNKMYNIDHVKIIKNELLNNINKKLNQMEINIYELGSKIVAPEQCMENIYNTIHKINNECNMIVKNKLSYLEKVCNNYEDRLEKSNPQLIFSKGFSIIEDKDGNIITSKKIAKNKKKLKLIFEDGYITVNIK